MRPSVVTRHSSAAPRRPSVVLRRRVGPIISQAQQSHAQQRRAKLTHETLAGHDISTLPEEGRHRIAAQLIFVRMLKWSADAPMVASCGNRRSAALPRRDRPNTARKRARAPRRPKPRQGPPHGGPNGLRLY